MVATIVALTPANQTLPEVLGWSALVAFIAAWLATIGLWWYSLKAASALTFVAHAQTPYRSRSPTAR